MAPTSNATTSPLLPTTPLNQTYSDQQQSDKISLGNGLDSIPRNMLHAISSPAGSNRVLNPSSIIQAFDKQTTPTHRFSLGSGVGLDFVDGNQSFSINSPASAAAAAAKSSPNGGRMHVSPAARYRQQSPSLRLAGSGTFAFTPAYERLLAGGNEAEDTGSDGSMGDDSFADMSMRSELIMALSDGCNGETHQQQKGGRKEAHDFLSGPFPDAFPQFAALLQAKLHLLMEEVEVSMLARCTKAVEEVLADTRTKLNLYIEEVMAARDHTQGKASTSSPPSDGGALSSTPAAVRTRHVSTPISTISLGSIEDSPAASPLGEAAAATIEAVDLFVGDATAVDDDRMPDQATLDASASRATTEDDNDRDKDGASPTESGGFSMSAAATTPLNSLDMVSPAAADIAGAPQPSPIATGVVPTYPTAALGGAEDDMLSSDAAAVILLGLSHDTMPEEGTATALPRSLAEDGAFSADPVAGALLLLADGHRVPATTLQSPVATGLLALFAAATAATVTDDPHSPAGSRAHEVSRSLVAAAVNNPTVAAAPDAVGTPDSNAGVSVATMESATLTEGHLSAKACSTPLSRAPSASTTTMVRVGDLSTPAGGRSKRFYAAGERAWGRARRSTPSSSSSSSASPSSSSWTSPKPPMKFGNARSALSSPPRTLPEVKETTPRTIPERNGGCEKKQNLLCTPRHTVSAARARRASAAVATAAAAPVETEPGRVLAVAAVTTASAAAAAERSDQSLAAGVRSLSPVLAAVAEAAAEAAAAVAADSCSPLSPTPMDSLDVDAPSSMAVGIGSGAATATATAAAAVKATEMRSPLAPVRRRMGGTSSRSNPSVVKSAEEKTRSPFGYTVPKSTGIPRGSDGGRGAKLANASGPTARNGGRKAVSMLAAPLHAPVKTTSGRAVRAKVTAAAPREMPTTRAVGSRRAALNSEKENAEAPRTRRSVRIAEGAAAKRTASAAGKSAFSAAGTKSSSESTRLLRSSKAAGKPCWR